MHLPRPLGRLVELAVFAPIGLVSVLRERWPAYSKQLAQNRQAVANRVQIAHLVGRMRVEGMPVPVAPSQRPSKERADELVSRSQGHDAGADVTRVESPSSAADVAVELDLDLRGEQGPAPSAESLPISDYESLAAMHVVHRLDTLRPDELEQIRVFEQANRARRTILSKIEQLQESAS